LLTPDVSEALHFQFCLRDQEGVPVVIAKAKPGKVLPVHPKIAPALQQLVFLHCVEDRIPVKAPDCFLVQFAAIAFIGRGRWCGRCGRDRFNSGIKIKNDVRRLDLARELCRDLIKRREVDALESLDLVVLVAVLQL
jgi:hypothetical protein